MTNRLHPKNPPQKNLSSRQMESGGLRRQFLRTTNLARELIAKLICAAMSISLMSAGGDGKGDAEIARAVQTVRRQALTIRRK